VVGVVWLLNQLYQVETPPRRGHLAHQRDPPAARLLSRV